MYSIRKVISMIYEKFYFGDRVPLRAENFPHPHNWIDFSFTTVHCSTWFILFDNWPMRWQTWPDVLSLKAGKRIAALVWHFANITNSSATGTVNSGEIIRNWKSFVKHHVYHIWKIEIGTFLKWSWELQMKGRGFEYL